MKKIFATCLMLVSLILISGCVGERGQSATVVPAQCKQINALKLTDQVGFREIIPGKTLQQTVQEILGSPRETSTYDDLIQWIYDDVTVSFTSDKVVSVSVHNKSQVLNPLIDVIQQYGCPEAIYAFSGNEDLPSQTYTAAMLIYAERGLTVYTKFPTSLDEIPNGIEYYIPESLDQYIRISGIQKEEVDWRDLITKNN